jgi:hypothetical protein
MDTIISDADRADAVLGALYHALMFGAIPGFGHTQNLTSDEVHDEFMRHKSFVVDVFRAVRGEL